MSSTLTPTLGTAQALIVDSGGNVHQQKGLPGKAITSTPTSTIAQIEGDRPTWRFGFVQVLPAAPTNVLSIVGAAGVKVRIKRIRVSGLAATALQNIKVQVVRQSAIDVGAAGSIVAQSPIASDIAVDGTTCVATVNAYLANGTTLGTVIGTIGAVVVPFDVIAGANNSPIDVVGGNAEYNSKPVVLNGTADVLALNFGGVTLANATTLVVEGIFDIDRL